MKQELCNIIPGQYNYEFLIPLILEHFGLDISNGWKEQLVHIGADDLGEKEFGQHRKVVVTTRRYNEVEDLAFYKQTLSEHFGEPYWWFFGKMELCDVRKDFVEVIVDYRRFLLYRTSI